MPPTIHPRRVNQPAAPPDSGGLFNVLNSLKLDTSVGQFLTNLDQIGYFELDPLWLPAADPRLSEEPWLWDIIKDSRSQEHANSLIERARRNNRIRGALQHGGASWSRFFSSFLDPVNFIPIPLLAGVGFVRGAARGAALLGGVNLATETARTLIDPTDTKEETLLNIGSGFLLGSAFGGIIGALPAAAVRRARVSREEREPTSGVRDLNDEIDDGARRYDAGFNQATRSARPEAVSLRERASTPPSSPRAGLDTGTRTGEPEGTIREPQAAAEPELPEAAQRRLPTDPATGERYAGPVRMLQRTREIQQELRAVEADDTPAGLVRAKELSRERLELEQALTEPEVKAALEDSVDRGPLTQAERDEFPTDSHPDVTFPPEGVRSVLREDRARLTNERDKVAAQRAEVETKIAELKRKAAEHPNPQQRGRFGGKRMRRLNGQLTALNERLATLDNGIEDLTEAIRSRDVSEIGSGRVDKNITGFLRTRQLPGFLMLNNRFADRLGERIARDFHRMMRFPGIRTAGTRQGVGAGEASVEAMKLQFIARYKTALDAMGNTYLEYIGKPRASVQSGIFAENLRQGKDNILASLPAPIRDRLNISETLVRDNLHGKRTWQEFKRDVTRYRLDPSSRGEFDQELLPHLEEANRAWSTFTSQAATELDRLGIFNSKANAQKRVTQFTQLQDRLARIIEDKTNRKALVDNAPPEQLRAEFDRFVAENPSWRRLGVDRWKSRYSISLGTAIRAAETQKAKIARYREEAEMWLESVESGLEESAADYVPRIWRKDLNDAELDELLNVLVDHFTQNPVTRFNGRRVELSTDPADVRERARLTLQNIQGNSDGSSQAARSFAFERLEAQVDEIEIRLAPFESATRSDAPPATVIDGPTSVGVRGTDDYRPAFTTYNGDGTWTINLDREQLRADYREDARTAKKWGRFFDTEEKFVEFVERHERAHTRLRKGDIETRAEYERRINQEAWKELTEGTPPRTNAMADLEAQRARAKEELLREERRGAHTPAMLIGRRLDLPDSRALPFIETDIEAIMSMYAERLGPIIDMTKKFGDYRLDTHLTDIAMQMDQQIELAPTNQRAAELTKERDLILNAYEDARDVVLGRYGVPENPDRIDRRAFTTLKNWALMSQMGKAWQAAVPDTGRIALQEGLMRTFGGLWRAAFQGMDPNSAWARGADEARKAGLVSEIAMGYRWQAITGVKFGGATKTALERGVERGARGMFLVNGLAHYTDTMEKFASTLIIDRILKAAGRVADGKGTKTDISELAEFGIDVSSGQHLSLVSNWRGSVQDLTDLEIDGLAIANTDQWRNPEVAHTFRGMLAQAVKDAVLTPGQAERPLFMSEPAWQTIFLYKMFAVGATFRVTLAGLQGKHAHLIAGITSMVALGAVVDAMRRPDWAETNIGELLYRAIDRSGVTGVVTDINNTLEAVSYNSLGVNPALGLTGMRGARDPNIAEAIGAIAGPSINQWAYLAWAMTAQEADSDEVARAWRYVTPYNNWFMVSDLFTTVQRSAAEVLEGE